MKNILAIALSLSLASCGYPPVTYDDGPWSETISMLPENTDKAICGLYEFPHEHTPIVCGANPWTHKGVCCTWVTQEYYSECITAWCVNEHLCEWHINQRSCKPI